jgi:hypothetical protein
VGQQGIASGYPANIPGDARRSHRRSSQTTGVRLQHLWSLSVSGLPPAKHLEVNTATGVHLWHLWSLSVSGLPPAKHSWSQHSYRSPPLASVVSVGKWPTASQAFLKSTQLQESTFGIYGLCR